MFALFRRRASDATSHGTKSGGSSQQAGSSDAPLPSPRQTAAAAPTDEGESKPNESPIERRIHPDLNALAEDLRVQTDFEGDDPPRGRPRTNSSASALSPRMTRRIGEVMADPPLPHIDPTPAHSGPNAATPGGQHSTERSGAEAEENLQTRWGTFGRSQQGARSDTHWPPTSRAPSRANSSRTPSRESRRRARRQRSGKTSTPIPPPPSAYIPPSAVDSDSPEKSLSRAPSLNASIEQRTISARSSWTHNTLSHKTSSNEHAAGTPYLVLTPRTSPPPTPAGSSFRASPAHSHFPTTMNEGDHARYAGGVNPPARAITNVGHGFMIGRGAPTQPRLTTYTGEESPQSFGFTPPLFPGSPGEGSRATSPASLRFPLNNASFVFNFQPPQEPEQIRTASADRTNLQYVHNAPTAAAKADTMPPMSASRRQLKAWNSYAGTFPPRRRSQLLRPSISPGRRLRPSSSFPRIVLSPSSNSSRSPSVSRRRSDISTQSTNTGSKGGGTQRPKTLTPSWLQSDANATNFARPGPANADGVPRPDRPRAPHVSDAATALSHLFSSVLVPLSSRHLPGRSLSSQSNQAGTSGDRNLSDGCRNTHTPLTHPSPSLQEGLSMSSSATHDASTRQESTSRSGSTRARPTARSGPSALQSIFQPSSASVPQPPGTPPPATDGSSKAGSSSAGHSASVRLVTPRRPSAMRTNTDPTTPDNSKGKRKAEELETTPPDDKKEKQRTTFAPDPRATKVSSPEPSHAPTSYPHKRVRVTDAGLTPTSPTFPTSPSDAGPKDGSWASRASGQPPARAPSRARSTRSDRIPRSSNGPESVAKGHEEGADQDQRSQISIPLSALVYPHAPSIARSGRSGTYHMRDPRRPKLKPTPWSLRYGKKDDGGSPIQAWMFFIGFVLFPLWWVGSVWRIPKTRHVGGGEDPEKAVLVDDPQIEFDAKTWRWRCRIMALISLFTYVPFIVCVAVFVPRR